MDMLRLEGPMPVVRGLSQSLLLSELSSLPSQTAAQCSAGLSDCFLFSGDRKVQHAVT